MTGRDVLVGLDIGTTNCKALVLSTTGDSLSIGSTPTPWTRTPSGAEMSAADVLEAALLAISQALAPLRADGGGFRVCGVGVTGFAESGALLDRDDQPIGPVIAWYDQRGTDSVDELERDLGSRAFAARTGLALTTRPSVIKYRWMVRELGIGGAGVRWLNVPEWVAHVLGDYLIADVEEAGARGAAVFAAVAAGLVDSSTELAPPLVES